MKGYTLGLPISARIGCRARHVGRWRSAQPFAHLDALRRELMAQPFGHRAFLKATPAGAAILLSGCAAPQSTLDAAGRGAESIAELFWWLAGGALVIWLAVIGLAIYAVVVNPEKHSRRQAALLIIGGGTVVPTIVIGAYLIFGLSMLPGLMAPAPPGSLEIAVTGEQWWWRVRYLLPSGDTLELANEVRLPVGEPVQFYLDSPDVIHSFWVPPLGGKMDMVPGRVNRLTLEPTRTGVFHGVCAEYCGTSHALMTFYTVVMEKDAFVAWLEQEREPARTPENSRAARGEMLFLSNGCGSCHTVRGTEALGTIGPDLTHVGSRVSIGAGILPNNPDALLRWVAHTAEVKPDVNMPHFGMLPREDLESIATYLHGLK